MAINFCFSTGNDEGNSWNFNSLPPDLSLPHKPHRVYVMGVLNLSEDSFYAGSRVGGVSSERERLPTLADALTKMEQADIIDVGAESTRPGANPVAAAAELRILLPVVRWIKTHYPEKRISIDTYKSEVAQECINLGADMINDVSAGEGSKDEIFRMVSANGTSLVLMHKQGDPKTMQDNPGYSDVVNEVFTYLAERINLALKYGCKKDQLLIDVGIGFGKTLEHNLALLQALAKFKTLGVGVMVGASRKRMVGEITGKPVEERLAGTLGVHLAAALRGADILRVHDVAETCDALKGFFAVSESGR